MTKEEELKSIRDAIREEWRSSPTNYSKLCDYYDILERKEKE